MRGNWTRARQVVLVQGWSLLTAGFGGNRSARGLRRWTHSVTVYIVCAGHDPSRRLKHKAVVFTKRAEPVYTSTPSYKSCPNRIWTESVMLRESIIEIELRTTLHDE